MARPRCRCRPTDPVALDAALHELKRLPPLVTSWEILALKQQLAEAQEGKRFLLQGGDCAENFSDCESGTISNRLKVLLQMSLVLVHGLRQPVIAWAASPASTPAALGDTETRDGVTLPRPATAGRLMLIGDVITRRPSPRQHACRTRSGCCRPTRIRR